MSTVNEFVEEEFTNDIDQVLKPGDKVVAVTTGYAHNVGVFTGEFGGVWRRRGGDRRIVGTRVKNIPYETKDIVYCDDGEHIEYKWRPSGEKDRWGYVRQERYATGRRFNLVPVTKYRTSCLQRNRVFRIDTELSKVSI